MKELVIPPPAKRDKKSLEMIRAWMAEEGLHCTLNIGFWRENEEHDEAAAWGILLADVVRHVSNALNEQYGDDKKKTVRELVRSLAKELELPTSEAEGYFWQN